MGMNFPDTPTPGQVFGNYTWDATDGKWVTTMVGGLLPSAVNPAMNGVANPGAANAYSRGDHVHPIDTTRQPFDAQLFAGIPIKAPTMPYTCVLTDAQKCIAGVGAVTIPANASVAYPIGTAITFAANGGVMTVAIASDALYWNNSGAVASGTRTISNAGLATALKMSANIWFISGNGIT
jgi:hypothetical protein